MTRGGLLLAVNAPALYVSHFPAPSGHDIDTPGQQGFAGGFIQGGGHSPFSSMYGLASDNALEYEVITADGHLVTASPKINPDLFWALNGGGPGTYGVVWSVTVKTYPDIIVTGAVVAFQWTDEAAFLKALDFYHTQTPAWTDAGAYAYAFYMKGYFQVWPVFAPGKSTEEVTEMVRPFAEKLTELGIQFQQTVTTFPNFLEAFEKLYAPITIGGFQFGGRFIPRSVVQSEEKRAKFGDAIKMMLNDGALVLDVAIRPHVDVDSGANPEWRTAELLFLPAL